LKRRWPRSYAGQKSEKIEIDPSDVIQKLVAWLHVPPPQHRPEKRKVEIQPDPSGRPLKGKGGVVVESVIVPAMPRIDPIA
jgi:hypothetical protein